MTETPQHKLRVLFNVNAPWSTSGYGTQARDLLPMIRDAGFPTAAVCFYGLEGGRIVIDGITCYPKMGDTWGGDAVIAHQNHFQADIVFTLQDIWVLNPQHLAQFKRWIPIVPIDHEPVPPAVFERLKAAYRIVTYAEFGKKELQRSGLHSTYIQHTVNTEVLKPQDKAEARKMLNIPQDVYLFGMVAANKDNPPRKSFQRAMDAFKLFHEKHPKSALYFHTILNQEHGFPIDAYAKTLGIQDVVYSIAPYDLLYNVDRDGMSRIYSSFDCLLMPSTNEGFGVPAVEAQACGVPAIVNNFTSMPELIDPGKTGLACDIDYKRYSPLHSFIGEPDVDSLYKCMEKMFSISSPKMSAACREWAVERYDLKKVFNEKWIPFLEKLEKEIYPEAKPEA